MTSTEHFHPRNLTFSQAQGYDELPGPLALEELSEDARRELWDLLYASVSQRTSYDIYNKPMMVGVWLKIAGALHSDFLKIPMDQFDPYISSFSEKYRLNVLRFLPFNRIFDLLQIVMRHDDCPSEFIRGVQEIFKFGDIRALATSLPC